MTTIGLDTLPEDAMRSLFMYCRVEDIAALSATCRVFYDLLQDDLLWKHFCHRDFLRKSVNFGHVDSYKQLYTNLLYKYGSMIGVYQCVVGPFGGLLEIQYKDGCLKGIEWGPSSHDDIDSPLKEAIVAFAVDSSSVPAKCVCLPEVHPHPCSLTIDKITGHVTQHCFSRKEHIENLRDQLNSDSTSIATTKLVFQNEQISKGFIYKPLILPVSSDIPLELKQKDGSCPSQIITPGIFQGTYSSHGIEIILFKYKDEHEIHGLKVTGDTNVYANQISVKILVKYPVRPPLVQQRSLSSLAEIEPRMSNGSVTDIGEQQFVEPNECMRDHPAAPPTTCKARYHGFGQIAFEGFQHPTFSKTHVMIFDNDLIGVLWLELESLSMYRRIARSFTPNHLSNVDSIL